MSIEDTLLEYYKQTAKENDIPADLYHKYNVKKGLRNENKTGVLVGLTRICDVVGYKMIDDKKVDCEGELYYRGISIKDIITNCSFKPGIFEETAFLLLFGKLPTLKEYNNFKRFLQANYELPDLYVTTNIMHLPAVNIMNKIQRALLMLYDFDELAEDCSVNNTLIQGLNLLAKMPAIVLYSYYSKLQNNKNLPLPKPNNSLSIAENILMMLKGINNYSEDEVILLDIIMTIHADHGGGNNSTFTNIVVSSTDSDMYSSLSAAVGSLKGPKHGGANEKVNLMMLDAINKLGLTPNEEDLLTYIKNLDHKKAFDGSGLIYGMGHAIYTISDPRAKILSKYCEILADKKGILEKLNFYRLFEDLASKYLYEEKKTNFGANLDFYSGLAYELLDIPQDLFLPIFAISRTSGWLAHNLENKLYCNKIIRPANQYIGEYISYKPLSERNK